MSSLTRLLSGTGIKSAISEQRRYRQCALTRRSIGCPSVPSNFPATPYLDREPAQVRDGNTSKWIVSQKLTSGCPTIPASDLWLIHASHQVRGLGAGDPGGNTQERISLHLG
jgi:hypothetical protein